jgi:hypothetical protein
LNASFLSDASDAGFAQRGRVVTRGLAGAFVKRSYEYRGQGPCRLAVSIAKNLIKSSREHRARRTHGDATVVDFREVHKDHMLNLIEIKFYWQQEVQRLFF